MFQLEPQVIELPCSPEDLVKVYRSMNMVKISVDDFVSEPSEAYIVTSRASGGLQTHIVFYLEAPAVRVLYGYDQNPYPPDLRITVEAEAADVVEQMGAILEDVGWDVLPASGRARWLAQEYLFRLGEPKGRLGASASTSPSPRPPVLPSPRPAPLEVSPAELPSALGPDFARPAAAPPATSTPPSSAEALWEDMFGDAFTVPAGKPAVPAPPPPPAAPVPPPPVVPVAELEFTLDAPEPPAPPVGAPPPSPPERTPQLEAVPIITSVSTVVQPGAGDEDLIREPAAAPDASGDLARRTLRFLAGF